jgi:hypothetical protein
VEGRHQEDDVKAHRFVIGVTCYWHHEHEKCARCGQMDKPDDPEKPCHLHHDERLDRLRMWVHPERLEHIRIARSLGLDPNAEFKL